MSSEVCRWKGKVSLSRLITVVLPRPIRTAGVPAVPLSLHHPTFTDVTSLSEGGRLKSCRTITKLDSCTFFFGNLNWVERDDTFICRLGFTVDHVMDTESWANAMLYITICQACAIDVVGYLVFDLLLTVWCPCKCRWMKEGDNRAWFYEEGVIHFSRLKKTVAQCRFVSDYVDNWTHKYGTKAKYCSSPVTRWTWMHLLVLGLEARQRLHDTRAVSCSQEGGCEWYTPRGFLSAKYLFYGCHFSEPMQDQSLRGLIEPRCAHFIPVKPHLKWTLLWLISPDWILAQLNISTQTSINPNLRYVSFCNICDLFGCIDNEISP